MKILVSGNKNYGVGQALSKHFPQAEFHSRSSGYDLAKPAAQEAFARHSLAFDAYISCSALHRFQQTTLLSAVTEQWLEHNHSGRIVVLGSTADTPVKGTPWMYPIEKKALKALCRNLGMMCLGGAPFRLTYLSLGYLPTPKTEVKHPDVRKIDLDYVCRTIEWILAQPPSVNVHELAIDPIQIDRGSLDRSHLAKISSS